MDYLTLPDILRHAAPPDQVFMYWSNRKRSVTYTEAERIGDRVAGVATGLD